MPNHPGWTARLPGDLRWGVRQGAMAAAVFSGWVTILTIARHSVYLAAPGWRPTLWELYAIYFGGGISAGAILGVLRPWTKYPFGAALAGIVAAIPVLSALQLGYIRASHPLPATIWIVVLLGAVGGGSAAGLVRWSQTYGQQSRSRDGHPR